MKAKILTGIMALAVGAGSLLAQAQPAQQPPSQPAGPKVPQPKSKEELQAVQALFQAQNDPDASIKAAEDLLSKYADTEFKEVALMVEAGAYAKKRDPVKAQIYAHRVLDINPKNFQATLMIGEMEAQGIRDNDLDKEDKLADSEKYLNQTIENLKTAAKPNPQLPDDQWEQYRKELIAQAHNDLGLDDLSRKKYDAAITEFKTSIEGDPQPAYQVRLASAYQSAGKNDEAIAICDKLLADPQLHPQIQAVAKDIKAKATQAKGGAGK
ncbi:MAG TPA: tetratricopeptide repeat protein [Bryobacteraceae bacterium]|nr:tetratricopeptide repeat protein [Bryobacteraceae bacterium]